MIMTTAILMNIYFFPQVNIGCSFDSTKFNRAFLLWVVTIDSAMRIMCLFFWNSTYLLNERNVTLKITQACLYAIWILYCITDFEKFTPHCYEPYPSLGLFIYMAIVILVLPAAFLVICVVSFVIIFFPCLVYTLWKSWSDNRERSQVKEKVIASLSRINFDARKFRASKDCAICFVEFEQDA